MAEITQTFSKNQSLRSANVDYLPKLPAHWGVENGKWLFKKENRSVGPNDEVVTCFRDGQVTLRSNRRTEGFTNALLEHGAVAEAECNTVTGLKQVHHAATPLPLS